MLIKLINNDEEFEWFYNKSMIEIELSMENKEKSDIMNWLMKNIKDLVLIHNKSLMPIKSTNVPFFGSSPLPIHNITIVAPNATSLMPAGNMSFNTNTGQMMISDGTKWLAMTTSNINLCKYFYFYFNNANDAMLFKLRWS